MTNLTDEVNRAARARTLLSDDLLVEAFDTLETTYTEAWRNSPPRDPSGRECIWMMLQAISLVRNHLVGIVQTGEMAEIQLSTMRQDPAL